MSLTLDQLDGKLLRYTCMDDRKISLNINIFKGNLYYTVLGDGGKLTGLTVPFAVALLIKNLWECELSTPVPNKCFGYVKNGYNKEEKKTFPEHTITHGYDENNKPYVKLTDNKNGNKSWSFYLTMPFGIDLLSESNVINKTVVEHYVKSITDVAEIKKALTAEKYNPNSNQNKSGSNYSQNNTVTVTRNNDLDDNVPY